MKELVQPDKLVWIDGSEEQLEAVFAQNGVAGVPKLVPLAKCIS